MNILITGGAGYVGSHVVLQLSEQAHCVVVCDDLSNSYKEAVIGAELYQQNIADAQMENLFKQYRFDVVMHFAASVSVLESMHNPYQYYMNNTAATLKLLQLCSHYKIKYFILSSTAAVYGTPDSKLIDENTPLAPVNAYGHSKLMCERLVMDISSQAGFRYVILRYFNVAGADLQSRIGENNLQNTHLVKIACLTATQRDGQMNLYGTDYDTEDGTCVRDYIHVLDIADAHIAAQNYLLQGGESTIFNCGYGHGYSVKEILNAVKRISCNDFKIINSARRAGDPPVLVADNNKIKKILNWQPHYDNIDIIIESALNWERKLQQTAHSPK
ncbi:MAG: UDP-glucose 4-epimerase GalE [Chromatiales bacterium]|nr:UDP-glucose 4-epimerase GalE [Chromatiales bacterium]